MIIFTRGKCWEGIYFISINELDNFCCSPVFALEMHMHLSLHFATECHFKGEIKDLISFDMWLTGIYFKIC